MQIMLSSRFNTPTTWLFILYFFMYALLPIHTSAQTPSFIPTGIHLEATPQFPEPNSLVTVSLNDYSVNTIGSTISWFVNGEEQVAMKNERSIKVSTHTLGTQDEIKVVLSRTNTPSLSATLTLVPMVIDIILEADTYTPSFYKGRPLPSTQSSIRATALVHDETGSIKDSYTYKWSDRDAVLFGGAMKGKKTINYDMPLFGSTELTVEIFNTRGVFLGKKTITVASVEPKLLFYEYNSLRGLSERAVSNSLPLIGEETTLYGEPYFMNTRMQASDTSFSWMINSVPANTDTGTPNAITLRKNGAGGSSEVSLKVVTEGPIPQFVIKQLQLIF